jgi:hypothetical protein
MRRLKKLLGWAFAVILAIGFVACVALCLLEERRPPRRTFLLLWSVR